MVTTFAIFLNTVEVCFDLNFDDIYPSVIFKIRYIIIGFYTLCIFLSLNTAISSKGMIEHRRKEILIMYVSNRLISDALAIISFIRFYDLQRVGRDIIKLFILAQVNYFKEIIYLSFLLIFLVISKNRFKFFHKSYRIFRTILTQIKITNYFISLD